MMARLRNVSNILAFDPIFFLHHTNVDRMLSLWHAIHYDKWVTKGDSEQGTLIIPKKTNIDENTGKNMRPSILFSLHHAHDCLTELAPFWKTQSTAWKSSEVKDTSVAGYIYPEFVGLKNADQATISAAIQEKCIELYAPKNVLSSSSDDHALDWAVRIRMHKYEVEESFLVLIFLGDVPTDSKDWFTSPNFVGAHGAFVNRYVRFESSIESVRTESKNIATRSSAPTAVPSALLTLSPRDSST